MRIVILGTGIAGVASAWYLSQAGHDVTVIDRESGAAQATSFANSGQLSFAYTTPWANADIPLKAIKWLFKSNSPLIFRPDGSLFQMCWLKQMLAQCNDQAYTRNQKRMLRISQYSRAMFKDFLQQHTLQFDHNHLGTLHLFRETNAFHAHEHNMKTLNDLGIPYQTLDPQACLQYEPALINILPHIAGAFHLPQDQTGDCHQFATQLMQMCQQHGVTFKFNHHITRLSTVNNHIQTVHTDSGDFDADVFVCALGSFSRPLLTAIQLDIPVYPVKGYSLTMNITQPHAAPRSTVLDESYKVAITRLGSRMRIGGMAELSGYERNLIPRHRQTLSKVVNELFPNSCQTETAQFWTGLRPMTPDSTPIIGRTHFDNLFLNTGHGTLGWTMSLGSGKIIADLISTGKSEIKIDDLDLSRYA